MHDLNNVLKKFLKELETEMAKIGEANFSTELKKIENCINSSEVVRSRENPYCAKNLNILLAETTPNDQQKIAIALIKDPNFFEKSEDEQAEMLARIRQFPSISGIFKVRFRSWKQGLQGLLMAKPIIQQAALISSPHHELMPDSDLKWDLVECLFSIFSEVSKQTDIFESLTATSSNHIQSYFDLLMFTLDDKEPTSQR